VNGNQVRTSLPRNAYDFYPTPEWCYEKLPIDWSQFKTAHEPCKGDGRIVSFLQNKGIKTSWTEIQEGKDYFEWDGEVDLILTNPPFSIAREFIEHSIACASTVIMLLRIIRRVAWWNPQLFSRMFDGNDPDELGIRSSIALMLVLVGVSVFFDIEPILGAFLAGTIFAFTFSNRGTLESSLKGFSYGFLIPIFFINIGLNYDISVFSETQFFVEVGYLFLIAVGVKFIPSLLLVFSKIKFRDMLAGGFLLSARFSLIIAMAEIGVHLDLISKELEQQIILLAVITATFSPILFRLVRTQTK